MANFNEHPSSLLKALLSVSAAGCGDLKSYPATIQYLFAL
jgi:hypothetical protein